MSAQQVIELQMNNISIAFPGVQALKEVNFHTVTGRSHALIGANGAGKSTLMKVLSGAYVHYTGQILMDGTEVHIRSPKDAKELGIQIVYQEVDTALIPNLTVGENMMLDTMVHDMKGKQFMSWRKLHREAQEVLNRIHVQVSSKQLVQELTLAQKQMVLIARAISRACKFLILDEPTAPLSHAETEELFRIVRMLKQEQVGIIFISHRLPELFQICDDITIMRDGEFIMREQIASMTQSEVVDQMLGRSLGEQYPKTQVELGPIQLELKQFTDREKIEPIDLYARKGEIVGIAGLVGAGKTELCKALFGASVMTAGEVLLNGKRLSIHSPHEAVKLGFALVPEERRKEGIWISESVTINLSAASLGQFTRMRTWLRSKRERASARRHRMKKRRCSICLGVINRRLLLANG